MSDSGSSQDYVLSSPYDPFADDQRGDAAQVSPLVVARRLLRGRYKWAITLGVVFGAGGAYLGHTLPEPTYESSGLINIKPRVTRILYKNEDNDLLPMFDAYVESQAALMRNRRVIDLAMETPEWTALGRGASPREIAEFQGALKVKHPARSQNIQITFTDVDPGVAKAAVNGVISAYSSLLEELEGASGSARRNALDTQERIINGRLTELRSEELNATGGIGAGALKAQYESTIDRMSRLDDVKHELDLEIETAMSSAASHPEPAVEPREMSDDEISYHDQTVSNWMLEKGKLEGRLEFLQGTRKLGARDPEVAAAQQELRAVNEMLRKRLDAIRAANALLEPAPEVEGSGLAELERRRDRLTALRDSEAGEAKRLAKLLQELANIEADRQLQSEKLEEVKHRIDAIDVEEKFRGRVSVLSGGDLPVRPEKDRRKAFAALGGIGGLSLGFLVVLLWALRNARMRHLDDLQRVSSRDRFVGIVPEITPGSAGDGVDSTDYCIHHIRSMMQLRAGGPERVVALTSPTAGSGKTTFGLTLAASFGATGSRTLLVDCDFVGRGLSSAVGAIALDAVQRALAGADETPQPTVKSTTARIVAARARGFDLTQARELLSGQLARTGDISALQSREVRALESYLRYLDPARVGPHGRPGALGALNGCEVEDCVLPTALPGVSVLPSGDAGQADASKLSPAALERLVRKCRERYDTVLIDTGPLLGSLEAAFVAAAADEVVVVVSRGEREARARETFDRLEHNGAEVAGIVFNRATAADTTRSSYASRSGSGSSSRSS